MKAGKLEYRVCWRREGMAREKRKRFATERGARQFLLLFGPEPWLRLRKKVDPDAPICCSGYECGCEGQTHRERAEAIRRDLPAIRYIRLESRAVGEWTPARPDPAALVKEA